MLRFFFSYTTHSSIPGKHLPLFLLGRYNLATLLLMCMHPIIVMIFVVLLSLLTSFSFVQSTIVALERTAPTAQAFNPIIRFPLLNLNLKVFLILLIYLLYLALHLLNTSQVQRHLDVFGECSK